VRTDYSFFRGSKGEESALEGDQGSSSKRQKKFERRIMLNETKAPFRNGDLKSGA